MKKIVKSVIPLTVIWLTCLALFSLPPGWADEGNIDATYRYAWSETAGWLNFRPTHGGVAVHDTYLSGYAWAKNTGWIRLGSGTGPYANTTSSNWGVNRNSVTGALSGYAWSENAGWINFASTHSQVSIALATASFDGYAWSENAGWVHIKNASPGYNVVVAPPTIASFTHASGGTGTTVTIIGTNFVGTEVKFGGTDAASFTVDSPTRITAVVGCCCAGVIEVKTVGLTGSSPTSFTYAGGDILARATPSYFKITVTKVEMHDGTSWVTIFSGTAQLDLAAGGTFPGISDLTLPAGTYSQARVTFGNSLSVKCTVRYNGTDYYTRNAIFFGRSNRNCCPTTDPSNEGTFCYCNSDWGAHNADVIRTFSIPPILVGPTTDYQPTLRFDTSDTLVLRGTAGNVSSYYLELSAPTVSLVAP